MLYEQEYVDSRIRWGNRLLNPTPDMLIKRSRASKHSIEEQIAEWDLELRNERARLYSYLWRANVMHLDYYQRSVAHARAYIFWLTSAIKFWGSAL